MVKVIERNRKKSKKEEKTKRKKHSDSRVERKRLYAQNTFAQ